MIQNDTLTPEYAKKYFYNLLKKVNENHTPIIISDKKSHNSAVIISKDEWDSIQETLYLEDMGVMNKVRAREQDNSLFTNVNDINWNNL